MTTAGDSSFSNYFWSIFFINFGQFFIGIRLRDDIRKELQDGEHLSKIATAGCLDEAGLPVQCTVEQDQATWGTICIDGYTYDAMPCSDIPSEV